MLARQAVSGFHQFPRARQSATLAQIDHAVEELALGEVPQASSEFLCSCVYCAYNVGPCCFYCRRYLYNIPQIFSYTNALMDKPGNAGTRFRVELIFEKLGCGDSVGDLPPDYPFPARYQILT